VPRERHCDSIVPGRLRIFSVLPFPYGASIEGLQFGKRRARERERERFNCREVVDDEVTSGDLSAETRQGGGGWRM
jgi:hypothetical protein